MLASYIFFSSLQYSQKLWNKKKMQLNVSYITYESSSYGALSGISSCSSCSFFFLAHSVLRQQMERERETEDGVVHVQLRPVGKRKTTMTVVTLALHPVMHYVWTRSVCLSIVATASVFSIFLLFTCSISLNVQTLCQFT